MAKKTENVPKNNDMTITTPGVIALASFDVGFFAFLPRWVSAFRQFFRVYTLAGETPSVTWKSLHNHFLIEISTTNTTINVKKVCASDERVCAALRHLQWKNKTSDRQLEAILDLFKELSELLQNGEQLPDKINSEDREMRKKVMHAYERNNSLTHCFSGWCLRCSI